MLQSNKLNALFQLLEEMTLPIKTDSAFAPSQRIRRIENGMMVGIIATMVLFVLIAAWYRYGPGTSTQNIPKPVYITYFLSLLISVLYLISVSIGIVRILWRHRHKRFSAILITLKNELHSDSEFLAQLWTFDKPMLEYGLLQYRHCWGSFDGRVAILAGDVRKLGLFPALAAASLSATTLLKEDSTFFLWAPVILACCFYLIAFHAFSQRDRPEQVIALLKYAVQYADEPVKSTQTEQTPRASAL